MHNSWTISKISDNISVVWRVRMTGRWCLTAGACQCQLKMGILHFVFSVVSMCNAEGTEGRSIAENLQYADRPWSIIGGMQRWRWAATFGITVINLSIKSVVRVWG